MENVEFEENPIETMQKKTYASKPRGHGLNGFIQKIGLAQSDKGANNVLIVIAIIFFLLAITIFMYSFTSVSLFPGEYHPVHKIGPAGDK